MPGNMKVNRHTLPVATTPTGARSETLLRAFTVEKPAAQPDPATHLLYAHDHMRGAGPEPNSLSSGEHHGSPGREYVECLGSPA